MARVIVQARGFDRYESLLEMAIESVEGEVTSMRAAFAYATVEGVQAATKVISASLGPDWNVVRKRWLIGIDWFRSKPQALVMLGNLPHSAVRVPGGRELINAGDCVPRVPFHPKALVIWGRRRATVLFGSGNLSRSGLTRGCEVGGLLIFGRGQEAIGRLNDPRLRRIIQWFDGAWRSATPMPQVVTEYSALYRQDQRLRNPIPTDDDQAVDDRSVVKARRRVVSPELLQKLRVCDQLWIKAGNLHKNRGPGRPGNQLMMSPMTRVFFGFPAIEVDRDTLLGHVSIQYKQHHRDDYSLRFSNNSMDVLSLPIPGVEGPPAYDQEILLFTRSVTASRQKFILKLGSLRDARQWRRASQRIDGLVTMTSGRTWGVF